MTDDNATKRDRRVRSLLALGGRALITLYQHTLSPLLGSSCRFTPSCSRYAHEAIGAHGFVGGSWMGLKRIGRCHPLSDAGYDPVPDREVAR